MSPHRAGERILLIRLSAVGDVLNVLPALGRLRAARPAAHLTFLVEDRARALVEGHPDLDDVLVFPRRAWREHLTHPARWPRLVADVRRHAERLRAGRFDVTLDFQGNLKGALHALASGAPRRIGFARGYGKEGSHLAATEHVVPPAERPHRVEKFAALLGPLGIPDEGALVYRLPSSAVAEARAVEFLAALPHRHGPLIAAHPGSSAKGERKRWPADRYGELAVRLASRRGATVVVTHGPGEGPLAAQVLRVAASAPGARVATGGPGAVVIPAMNPEGAAGVVVLAPAGGSLLDLAALLSRVDVFVSADTGPMHLAAAVGARCVALFGPKDPRVYRPWGAGHRVLRPRLPAEASDMTALSVDEVSGAALELLDALAQPTGLEGPEGLGYGIAGPRTPR